MPTAIPAPTTKPHRFTRLPPDDTADCDSCGGSGEGYAGGMKCYKCGGRGYIINKRGGDE